jgi:hypothetical protein
MDRIRRREHTAVSRGGSLAAHQAEDGLGRRLPLRPLTDRRSSRGSPVPRPCSETRKLTVKVR